MPAPLPPPAEEGDISVVGQDVTGPGGIVFGRLHRLGLFNAGQTSIDDFFKQDRAAFANVPVSIKRVMRAVSRNEGKIEAINTWDNGVLSFGVYQWTIGRAETAGELPGLLEMVKRRSPAAFENCFESLGLGFLMTETAAGELRRGFLTLNGVVLDDAERKERLRSHLWAYRFWRAAHHADVRRAQIELAMSRLKVFYRKPVPDWNNRRISAYISSEYGVALLLDQHVNRPAHVPQTLAAAIADFVSETGRSNPRRWTDSDEAQVLAIYLRRRAETNMTDSNMRAERTRELVVARKLSQRRGSFRMTSRPR